MSRNKRGQAVLYDQVKNAGIYFQLTPSAKSQLQRKIEQYNQGLSQQEFMERLARGSLDPERFYRIFFESSN